MTPFPNSEILIERIGWLLFHSLWQFAFIGIAAALLFWLLRGARPAIRYALGLAFLAAIVLAPIITWLFTPIVPPTLPTPATSTPTSLPSPVPNIAAPPLNQITPLDIPTTARNFPIEAPNDRPHTITSTVAPPVPSIPWMERLTIALNPWLETCVALWCGGVLLFSLRPLIGWIAQRRFRRIGTHSLTVPLAGTWEQARQRLRIRQRVQLLQSTLAPSPMVVGYLRPVILLPTTVVNSLPARRIEAILLHELAHIRRHDWLVNTLQTLVETLFFHHPAVWWLSARIRHERELCCDEIAAQALGDRAEYGRALVDLENLRDAPLLALSARGGSLLDRIRKLARTEVPRSNSTALVSLAVATLLLISLGAWSVGEAEGKQRPEPPDSLLMSLDEQKAWEELIAMNLNSPEVSRRNMRLQRLKREETSHFPDDQIQQLRRQLQEPIRSMHPWNIPEEAWPLIARLKSLETLTVTAGDLPRTAFESIAKLPKLKSLRVINARCLPTDAVALKKATNLEELDFMFTVFDMSPESRQEMIGEQTSAEQAWAESYRKEHDNREHIIEAAILTDRMLQELRDLPNLKRITLTNTSVSSRGAVAIAAHAGLEKLDVNFIDFSPEAARAIGSLKELRHFQVAEGANDETVSHLAGLTNLEFLQLWGDSITDASTAHLTKLHSLRYLNLYNSSLSDSGLLELAKLRHLKRLQLGSSKTTFTPEGIAEFRRLLPECELVVTEPKIESLSLDSMGADGPPTANADGADSMSHGDEQVRIPDDIPWGPESNGLRVRIIPVAPGTIPKGAKSPQRANQFVTSDDMIFLVELKNVSDEVIHLPGIHDSPAFPIMPEIRSHNDLARLFEVEFTDVSGNPVSGLKREIVNDIIREVVHPIAIGDTVRVVLAPGRFSSPLDHQLPKGEYTVKISYMGLKDDFISLAPGGKESNADSWQGRATSQAATFSIQQTPPSLAENELVWGEPTNGLQAAVKFSTPPDDPPIQYPPNNVPLNSRVDITFHIRNVSDTPISFASETWRQGDQLTIRNMRGDPREVNSTWYSGIPTLARWTLQPGETAKIRTASLGIADKAHQSPNSDRPEAFDYPAGYRWYAEKGIYSVQFTIRSPSVTRGSPEGKQTFPSDTDWHGELQTGEALLMIVAQAAEAMQPRKPKLEDDQQPDTTSVNDSKPPHTTDSDVSPFDRIVSLQTNESTLQQALDEVARQAGTRIEFDQEALNAADSNTKSKPATPSTFTGRVVDIDGKPIPGAFVAFSPTLKKDGKWLEYTTTADERGHFELTFPDIMADADSPVVSRTIWAWHEGFSIGGSILENDSRQSGASLEITLPEPYPRAFQILAPGGKPLANARLNPVSMTVPQLSDRLKGGTNQHDRIPESLQARCTVTSDASGRITMTSVAQHMPGLWQVSTEDFGDQFLYALGGELRLSEVAELRGVVEGIQHPTLLHMASLHDSDKESIGGSSAFVLTDANGKFHTPKVVVGPLEILEVSEEAHSEDDARAITLDRIEIKPGKNEIQLIRESKKPLVDETSPANSATPKGTHSDENTGEPTAMREWSGQIIDEKGRPLEGVRVVPTGWLDISGHFTRGFPLIEPTRVSPTDKQGNFSVSIHRDAVPEDWQVVTFIRISSFHQPTIVLSRDPLRLQVMSRTDFNAAFAPSAAHNKNTAKERIKKPNSLSGKVIDQHGKPIPGAFVVCAAETLRDGMATAITTTADDKGRFILEFPASIFGNEPRTASKTVWAWHEGLAMGFVKCTIDDILAGKDLRITLPPAFHRSFRILDPKGQPLANADITPDHLYTPAFNNDIGGSSRLPDALKARVRKISNDAGSVTVESVAEHQYESWQVRTEELGIQLFHGRQGNLQYSDVASISGEVEGLQAPILLKIFSDGRSNARTSIGRSLEIVLTDDNGLFEIPRFATRSATVMSLRNSTVGKQGTALLKQTPINVTPGKMKLQLQAEQGIRVRGRIVDERTQKGITGVSVTLLSNVGESGGLEHIAWVGDATDTNGEFEVLGVPGSTLLSVSSNQHPEHFHQTSFFKIKAGAEEIRLSEMQKKPHGSLTQARILETIPDSTTAK